MSLGVATGTSIDQPVSETYLLPFRPAPDSFLYESDEPGESVLKNIVGPVDQPERIRYAVSNVADVFKGTGVTLAEGQTPAGISVLTQVTQVWAVMELGGPVLRYLPVSAHFVLKLPVDPFATAGNAASLLAQLVGAVARDDTTSYISDDLGALLHGVTRLRDPIAGQGS